MELNYSRMCGQLFGIQLYLSGLNVAVLIDVDQVTGLVTAYQQTCLIGKGVLCRADNLELV